jgi:hypothetical protein
MTLVVDRVNTKRPQLHALIVGIGSYPYLTPGNPNVPAELRSLEQLDPPPLVSQELARWFENLWTNSVVELGSIDLLISDPAGPVSYTPIGGGPKAVDTSELANIVSAYDDWFDRCDANSANIALLYLCGHGIVRSSNALVLAADACKTPRPLDHAIDFTSTVSAMNRCYAEKQILVADSCQQESRSANAAPGGGNAHILYRQQTRSPIARNALSFEAAIAGTKAFGQRGQLTRFAQAFLGSLAGQGGRRLGGKWAVTLGGFLAGTESHIRHGNLAPRVPTQVSGGRWEGNMSMVLHELARAPEVPVNLECDPTAAIAYADFRVERASIKLPIQVRVTASGWQFPVPADRYTAFAEFPGKQFSDARCDIWAVPPDVDETLRVPP